MFQFLGGLALWLLFGDREEPVAVRIDSRKPKQKSVFVKFMDGSHAIWHNRSVADRRTTWVCLALRKDIVSAQTMP